MADVKQKRVGHANTITGPVAGDGSATDALLTNARPLKDPSTGHLPTDTYQTNDMPGSSRLETLEPNDFRPFADTHISRRNDGIVIVGAGLAGLFTALKLAPLPVTVISPTELGSGSSSGWAQGGMAAAVGLGDTPEAHAYDTIRAGAGLVDPDVADVIAQEAPELIRDLLSYGVPFDQDLAGHFVLSKEAAHSQKRVVRVAGDRAGHAIMQALIATVRATPSIKVLEGYSAHELRTANGQISGLTITTTNETSSGRAEAPSEIVHLQTSSVILATGGFAALYRATTNPTHNRGDGLAMASAVGAIVADPEFIQFHPTALDVDARPTPLATEALRGEGAILVDRDGQSFMGAVHPDADLAPRDIVARAVFSQRASGAGAFLDCRAAIGAKFDKAFPTVFAHCRKHGFDPRIKPFPVTTTAHYCMGGLATDLRARTNVPGLWAVGEIASTGLHGANRLASNSLIEAVVMGARAAKDISALSGSSIRAPQAVAISSHDTACRPTNPELINQLTEIMSDHVGVVRSAAKLKQARAAVDNIIATAEQSNDQSVRLAATAALFVIEGALGRRENCGAHFRSDAPQSDTETVSTRTFLRQRQIANVAQWQPAAAAVMRQPADAKRLPQSQAGHAA
ncbi:MAG: L-aspartate oxidase [Pseudomonadota bacterium]